MARPQKKGLDFFPVDVVFEDSIELLEAECGLEGLAILIKLWQKIYRHSYYIEWEEDNCLLFARAINSEVTKVNSVINVCFKRDIFDKELHKRFKILTSKAIQKRYIKICSDAKRANYEIDPKHDLLSLLPKKQGFTPEESTQSKEKKRKEKNKYVDFVMLTSEEYDKLVETFGKEEAQEKIVNLNNYIGSTGKRYKSHYHTILTWARKDEPKKKKDFDPKNVRITG